MLSRIESRPTRARQIRPIVPSTSPALATLDPSTLSRATPGWSSTATRVDTTTSGSEVPHATTVRPTTHGLTPNRVARVAHPHEESAPLAAGRSQEREREVEEHGAEATDRDSAGPPAQSLPRTTAGLDPRRSARHTRGMTAPVIALNGLYHAEDPMLRLRRRYPDAVRRAGGFPLALAQC